MRVIIFSDTHGDFRAADHIVQSNSLSDHFIFLGDGLMELEVIREKYPEKNIYFVKGNCDDGDYPESQVIEIFNTKIYMTHGHLCDVKNTHDELKKAAKDAGASVALYGHTHCRYYSYIPGLHILNPGSAAKPKDGLPPSYAFMDITPCGISCVHVDLER